MRVLHLIAEDRRRAVLAGRQSLATAAQQGYDGLLSFGYYLDLISRLPDTMPWTR
jgi:hypothetical protein